MNKYKTYEELEEELKNANDTLDTHNELIKYLQQRIDKAIEYIEETAIRSILEVHCGEEEEYTEPLLKILKGED